MMQAGKLRNRVVLQLNTPAGNTVGQAKPAWSDVGTYWAEVRPLSGREAIVADRLKSTATLVVSMRHSGLSIDPAVHRIRFGTRILNIESAINVDERSREWTLMVREVRNPA